MELEECLNLFGLGIFSGGLFSIAPVMVGYGIEKAFNWLQRSVN